MSEAQEIIYTLQAGDQVQITLSLIAQITVQTPHWKVIKLPPRTVGYQSRVTGAKEYRIFRHLLRRYLAEEFADSMQKNIEAVLIEMEKTERTLRFNAQNEEKADG